jgi:hypothetical protein
VPAHRDRHLSRTADQHGTLIDVGFVDDRDVDIAEVAACRGPFEKGLSNSDTFSG